jgi:hypothetical protein
VVTSEHTSGITVNNPSGRYTASLCTLIDDIVMEQRCGVHKFTCNGKVFHLTVQFTAAHSCTEHYAKGSYTLTWTSEKIASGLNRKVFFDIKVTQLGRICTITNGSLQMREIVR